MTKLIVIAAPSGTGKTSLIKALLEDLKEIDLKLSVSYTTRKKRIHEIEGESYFFIDEEKFENMLRENKFLEYAEVFGNKYGTSRSWVEKRLKEDSNILLELDWQGAMQVKSAFPDSITIFIFPPYYRELKSRLYKRGQDKEEVIKKRFSEAKKEIEKGKNFDFLVVNDIFDKALQDLRNIILKENKYLKSRKELAHKHLKGLLEE